ncbi:hypothetical protein X801_04974, partial [Opisthorchis viverrini]
MSYVDSHEKQDVLLEQLKTCCARLMDAASVKNSLSEDSELVTDFCGQCLFVSFYEYADIVEACLRFGLEKHLFYPEPTTYNLLQNISDKCSEAAHVLKGKQHGEFITGPCQVIYLTPTVDDPSWSIVHADELPRTPLTDHNFVETHQKRIFMFGCPAHSSSSSVSPNLSDHMDLLYQPKRNTLYYAKNNVRLGDGDENVGYLALCGGPNGPSLRWTSNELLLQATVHTSSQSSPNVVTSATTNGDGKTKGGTACEESKTPYDESRHRETQEAGLSVSEASKTSNRRHLVSGDINSSTRQTYININLERLEYIHIHQDTQGTRIVLIGNDGVQYPTVRFLNSQSSTADFVSALDNALAPGTRLTPVLNSIEGPLVQLILRGLHGHQRLRQDGFSFEFGSDSDANHSVIRLELKDNLYCGPTQARESFDSDSLFDPVVCWPSNRLWITSKPQGWNSTCLKTLDVKSKSASSTPGFMRKLVGKARHSEEESDKNRHKLINFSLFKSDVMDAGAIEAEGNNGHVIDGCPKENRSHTNTDASTATQILSEEVANSTQNQIPKQWPELVYRIVHLPVCTSQSEPSDMSSTSISPLCKNSDASNRKLNGSIESLSVSLDAIKRKLVANVFCAWLSHMRLMRFVRKNLKCLVMPKSGVECPGTSGLTFERWSELFLQLSEEDRKVWPYLLGLFSWSMSESEKCEKLQNIRESYETKRSEWMALEQSVQDMRSENDTACCTLSSESNSSEFGRGLRPPDFEKVVEASLGE